MINKEWLLNKDVHKIVVFPALSKPKIRIRTSLEPNKD